MRLTITVDVERDLGDKRSFKGIDEGLPFILDQLERFGIKATFFINGEALDYLVKKGFSQRILNGKHEVSSHGYRHIDYRVLPTNTTIYELGLYKEILENTFKRKILGYRSPQFRIDSNIIEALRQLGFLYDSSIFYPNCLSAAKMLRNVRVPYEEIEKVKGSFREFFIPCVPVLKFPCGVLWLTKIGFLPYKFLFKKIRDEHRVIYIHPFDFVDDRISFEYGSLLRKLFYNVNLESTKSLFIKLLKFWHERNVEFFTFEDILNKEVKNEDFN